MGRIGHCLESAFFPHPEVVSQLKLGAKVGTQLAPARHPVEANLKIDDEMQRIIQFCEEESFFSEMMNFMKWQDRKKFRRKFIHPLLKNAIIEMT